MYEPDQRHAEVIIRDCGVEHESKKLLTPGTKDVNIQADDDDEVEPHEATMHRALVAKVKLLGSRQIRHWICNEGTQ